MIQWRGAGVGAQTISLLWAEAVASELPVFMVIGKIVLDKIGPAAGASLAAVSGIARLIVGTVAPGHSPPRRRSTDRFASVARRSR